MCRRIRSQHCEGLTYLHVNSDKLFFKTFMTFAFKTDVFLCKKSSKYKLKIFNANILSDTLKHYNELKILLFFSAFKTDVFLWKESSKDKLRIFNSNILSDTLKHDNELKILH